MVESFPAALLFRLRGQDNMIPEMPCQELDDTISSKTCMAKYYWWFLDQVCA